MNIDTKIDGQGIKRITTTYDEFDRKKFEIDGDEYALVSETKMFFSEDAVSHDMHFRKILRIKVNG